MANPKVNNLRTAQLGAVSCLNNWCSPSLPRSLLCLLSFFANNLFTDYPNVNTLTNLARRYSTLRPSLRTTLSDRRSGRQSRATVRISHLTTSFNRSTIIVTYDDSDCCEWHFLSVTLPFRGEVGHWGGDWDSCRMSYNSRDMSQAHGFGSAAVRPFYGNT
jgi:hypothetical protein